MQCTFISRSLTTPRRLKRRHEAYEGTTSVYNHPSKSEIDQYYRDCEENTMGLAPFVLVFVLASSVDCYWKPTPLTNWTWQLNGKLDTSKNVVMYDLDLWDTPKDTITALKQAGRKVICYFRYAHAMASWDVNTRNRCRISAPEVTRIGVPTSFSFPPRSKAIH